MASEDLSAEALLEVERRIISRGDCAGPMTTFQEPGHAQVAIICRDNWDDVIRWLDSATNAMPRLVAEVRRRRALDLTAEEVEALRDLLNYLGPRVLREWKTTAPGMATLDKLLSHEPHDAHLQ